MKQNDCDIGTLASILNLKKRKQNPNVVKVVVKNEKMITESFLMH